MCAIRTLTPLPRAPPPACPPVGSTLCLSPLLDTSSLQTARHPLHTLPSTCTHTSMDTYPCRTSPGPFSTLHSTRPVHLSHTTSTSVPDHVYQNCFGGTGGAGDWNTSLQCLSLKFENLWDAAVMKTWNPSVLLPECLPEAKEPKKTGAKKKCLYNFQDAFMETNRVVMATSAATSSVSCTATTVQSNDVFHSLGKDDHRQPVSAAPRNNSMGLTSLPPLSGPALPPAPTSHLHTIGSQSFPKMATPAQDFPLKQTAQNVLDNLQNGNSQLLKNLIRLPDQKEPKLERVPQPSLQHTAKCPAEKRVSNETNIPNCTVNLFNGASSTVVSCKSKAKQSGKVSSCDSVAKRVPELPKSSEEVAKSNGTAPTTTADTKATRTWPAETLASPPATEPRKEERSNSRCVSGKRQQPQQPPTQIKEARTSPPVSNPSPSPPPTSHFEPQQNSKPPTAESPQPKGKSKKSKKKKGDKMNTSIGGCP
ncbi:hypothetical protein GOODEAATRI_025809 [Goodea atripinnis]|uniref:Uncharacterized protein n=1 Tax=Goodea atripinnis TaxID=208336 RepID=A0ABV0N4L1_9TELE